LAAVVAFARLPFASDALAQTGAGRAERGLAVDHGVAVRVYNPSGDIRIVGWDRDSVAASATPSAGSLVFGGGPAAVKVGLDSIAAAAGGTPLEVRVPIGARVWVQGGSGTAEASGDFAELEVHTVNGHIRVDGAPRRLTAETVDGDIDVEGHVASTSARTAGGTITLRYIRGDCSATTVSGPIRVGGGDLMRGSFETISGEISYKGRIERGGILQAQSHSGLIELRIPPETSADFDLTSYQAPVESELGPAASPAKHRRFSINGGSALVTARTFKGAIRVVRQPLP
jgi:hypothetical protein